MELQRILIIQTAFIGDVILATPLIRKLHERYPDASIDFLLRKGNEELLIHDPAISEVLVWDKKGARIGGILRLLKKIRSHRYDLVVNVQRFASMGLLTAFSRGRITTGFKKNPFSVFFTHRYDHQFSSDIHEIDRNLILISGFTETIRTMPYLVFNDMVEDEVVQFKNQKYVVIAPSSVWSTKQLPAEKWIEFLQSLPFDGPIYLIGSPDDFNNCETIRKSIPGKNAVNMAGKLGLLQSACLMRDAIRNYVNDSAPLHLASAVNAPVTAVFCSTVSTFGFGPLSTDKQVVEVGEKLECRPCGLHGFRKCPRKHFKCGRDIDITNFHKS